MSETFSEAFDDPPESRSEQSPATRARQPANERCQSTPRGSVKGTRRTFSRAEKLRILEAAHVGPVA